MRVEKKIVGLNAADRKQMKKTGFTLIEPLADFLKEYVEHIDDYCSFSEFYPRILDFCKVKCKDKVLQYKKKCG